MSAIRDIRAAEALSTKAAQKELSNDLDDAFELHVKAAQTFLHLARTLPDAHAKRCRAAAGRSLERAERIKEAKRDVRPVAADPYSTQEQAYILNKSAQVNGLRYPLWRKIDGEYIPSSEPFRDPDGQPALPITQQSESSWHRAVLAVPKPQHMVDTTLLPEHVVQNVVTDCSVVAAIAVCLGHQRRFASNIGISSIYPQNANGVPFLSENGMYTVRMFMNGSWRKLVIDDFLPILADGRLLGVCTSTNSVLWPPLLEKAYMKLMGGYDFPGSNSGTDLHTLVGWIPEHIHLRSAGFQMESTWNRVLQGFSTGQCVVTLGTPTSSSMPFDGLIPAHDYAVMDMQDDGADQYITLLDPWRDRDKDRKINDSQERLVNTHFSASPFQRLTWRETVNNFDIIHINWDPSRFSRQLYIHGLWKPRKLASKHSQSVSSSLRVSMKGAKSPDEEVWVLLTRHIVGKHKAPDFISLNVTLDDEFRALLPSDNLYVRGAYSDSVHILQRISPGMRDRMASIVTSIDQANTEVGYTIAILSLMDVRVDTQPPKGFHTRTLEGTLISRNSGGNFTYPTFMNNPQYRLLLRSDAAGGNISENTKAPIRFSVEGPKNLPLNLKIIWSKGQRVTELVQGDIVSDTGAYSYGVAHGESELQAGEYTLIVSTFEPGQQGPFELFVYSVRALELEPIPAEGAGMYTKLFRGAWGPESSAGAPSFGRYHANPIIETSIPNAAQIMIRLQLVTPTPASLNVSLFAADASGGFGPRLLTSGPYSDAIAGSLIPRNTIAPGKYLLVPSTYMPNVKAEFQILLYSTASGVDLTSRST